MAGEPDRAMALADRSVAAMADFVVGANADLGVTWATHWGDFGLGIKGFEALTRWLHPTRGIVGPNSWVPLAEEIGRNLTPSPFLVSAVAFVEGARHIQLPPPDSERQ